MAIAFIYVIVFRFFLFRSFIEQTQFKNYFSSLHINGSSTIFRQYVSFRCNVHSYSPSFCINNNESIIWYRFSVLIKSFTWKNDFLTSILQFSLLIPFHRIHWIESACLKLRHRRSNQTSKWYYYAFMSFNLLQLAYAWNIIVCEERLKKIYI